MTNQQIYSPSQEVVDEAWDIETGWGLMDSAASDHLAYWDGRAKGPLFFISSPLFWFLPVCVW